MARLATAGYSSVFAVPGTSIAGHSQSGIDGTVDKYRYSAPEVQWRDGSETEKILITQESDVYGMAMVAYEASSHRPVSSNPMVESHFDLLGLDRAHAILRVQRYPHIVKDTGRGKTPAALQRDC